MASTRADKAWELAMAWYSDVTAKEKAFREKHPEDFEGRMVEPADVVTFYNNFSMSVDFMGEVTSHMDVYGEQYRSFMAVVEPHFRPCSKTGGLVLTLKEFLKLFPKSEHDKVRRSLKRLPADICTTEGTDKLYPVDLLLATYIMYTAAPQDIKEADDKSIPEPHSPTPEYLDPEEEKALWEKEADEVARFGADIHDDENLDQWGIMEALPITIGNRSFLLLNDIAKLTGLREDEILGQVYAYVVDLEEFIDFEPEVPRELAEPITYDGSSLAPEEAFEQVLQMVETGYQEVAHLKLQSRSDQSVVAKTSGESSSANASIRLDKKELLEGDKAEEIFVDDFCARHQRAQIGRDASIAHYLGFLCKGEVLVFHSKYSPTGPEEVLKLKALSLLGNHFPIASNIDRVVAVDRNIAVHIFGGFRMYSVMANRALLALEGVEKDTLRLACREREPDVDRVLYLAGIESLTEEDFVKLDDDEDAPSPKRIKL